MRSRAHPLQVRPSIHRYSFFRLLPLAFLCRLEPCKLTQFFVSRTPRERDEPFIVLALVEPARDETVHRGVELVGGHAPKERRADLRRRAERAAHEDVV